MKEPTKEWLQAAEDDLATIKAIHQNPTLTNIVSFHAQQTVEKCFKAVMEEYECDLLKTHNLLRLYESVHLFIRELDLDMVILEGLSSLYTDSRYPTEYGLLPNGKPSLDEAKVFYQFALNLYDEITKRLSMKWTG